MFDDSIRWQNAADYGDDETEDLIGFLDHIYTVLHVRLGFD